VAIFAAIPICKTQGIRLPHARRVFAVRQLLLLSIALVSIAFAHARELFPSQYAQVPPEIQEWFRTQKIPGTKSSCCSDSDGVHGEQDVRNGKYWTRFVIQYHAYDCTTANPGGCLDRGIKTEQIDWMPVPDNAVIYNAKNPYLNPIIWWHREEAMANGVRIRCYVPAPES
jgi:hypothetical protein